MGTPLQTRPSVLIVGGGLPGPTAAALLAEARPDALHRPGPGTTGNAERVS